MSIMIESKNPLDVYRHTVQYCIKCEFPVCEPILYNYNSDEFKNEKFLESYIPFNEPAKIEILDMDSFDMAQKMNDNDGKILVLNLASETRSGGGVIRGAKAQEEDLYRKSNYFQAKKFYPLTVYNVIYSPLVYIIKDSSYKLLTKPHIVSCMAVAALRNPQLKRLSNGKKIYYEKSDKEIMQEKINIIFKIAIKHGHKNIVLGALGCGVYNNPVEEVAKMFKLAISTYGLYFKRIGFAILSGQSNSNFTTFKNIIIS